MFPQSALNFLKRKFFAGEVALHIFLTGLCNCLEQCVTGDTQILLGIIRNLTFFVITQIGETSACHLYHIHIADKLFIFADRELERSDTSSESSLQFQHELTEARMIVIHVGNENHSRQV